MRSLPLAVSGLVAAIVAASTAVPVQAQQGTLSRYRASETPADDFHLSRPTDLGHLRFGAQLHLDYALDPLVFETVLGDPDTETVSVVEHHLTGTLALSLGLVDRVVVYAGFPVTVLMLGAEQSALEPGVTVVDGSGAGDLFLGGRVRIVGDEDDRFSLAGQLRLTFPTSGDSTYRGDPSLTAHPTVVAEVRPIPELRVVANLGARFREPTDSDLGNLQFGHELTYGLGVVGRVWTDEMDPRTNAVVGAQLYGDSAFDLFGDREGTALEATIGMKLFHASGLVSGIAAGPGLNRGFGSPDLRVIGTIGWLMPEPLPVTDRDGDGLLDDVDECPDEPEDADGFQDTDGCPDPDNDQDGILDDPDECPNDPETVNGLEDEDGCPDEIGDTDLDGILDDTDECVNDPEDRDEFEDEDGCPDPDNDGDGILDDPDECPNEPGPPENQGCPDPDRDGDTVVDRLDNCPDEPGPPENQGCQAEQQVRIQENRIEILDNVYFRTGRATIQDRSHALLRNVAEVINAHPEIELIHVEGHTDSRGRRAYNMRLSQSRAEAVVEFLVEQGSVEASRLEAHGYGPDRPVVENARTREEHAQNRRVEFNIPRTEGVEQQDSGPTEDTIDR